MSRQIRFTNPAKQDLAEIYLYISDGNIAAADKHRERLTKRCLGLVDQPRIGTMRDDIKPGLRSVGEGDYVIFYRIVNETDLAIMRVVHGKRDLTNLNFTD